MRIALLQCKPMPGKEAALQALEQALLQAKAQGAGLLLTPEMYLTGYYIGAEACQQAAESLEDGGQPTLIALQALARTTGVALVTGLPERAGNAVYNTAVFIDENGAFLSSYRKTHLYGSVDAGQFQAGDRLSAVFDWHGWRMGLAICFDIEFPEVARSLALAGAEVLLVPTANMHPYSSVCRRIVPARAEENGLFIAYANYVGQEHLFAYCGQSCVCGPNGADLARADEAVATLIVVDLDKQQLLRTRQAVPYLEQRRPNLYTLSF